MTAPAPSTHIGGRLPAFKPRNNSFRNYPNRQGFRPDSLSLAGGAPPACRTLNPSGFQAASLIQIDHLAHASVSLVPFVAEWKSKGGQFSCVKNLFAALLK